MLPPGGLMEIVFSFDTTGSMSSCLMEVRGHIQDMAKRLQSDIPGIRMAVFAHGDYCDNTNYITKYLDFTTDINKLSDFVQTTGSTGGGDTDECYELVLRQVRENLSWTDHSKKSLVMFGDAPPHEPSYAQNTLNIDWREEADLLGDMGVKIYATQCQTSHDAAKFYESIAKKTGGHHLKLQDFSNVFDFLMAVAYREHGDDELLKGYEHEVRTRCGTGLHKDLSDLFTTLRDDGIITTVAVGTPKPTVATITKKRKADSTVTTTPKKRKTDDDIVTTTGKAKKVKLTTAAKTTTAPYSKTTTAARRVIKKAKRTAAAKPSYPLLRREKVPESNFYLNDQNWSPWQLIQASDSKLASNTDWKPKGSCYIKKDIFPGNPDTPSLFEFSVQTQPRARRHVVFNKMAHRVSGKWERRLFSKYDIKKQVEKIADRGYSLFVRRLPFTSDRMKTDAITALRRYDYSWKRIRNKRINHRRVEICSKVISDDSL